MKGNKTTVTVIIEALSIDSVPAILNQVAEMFQAYECPHGMLSHDDGDQVTWQTQTAQVEF